MADKKWRTYEEVAQYLLDEIAEQFGLERVEEKQKIVGLRSGREIEIDGKGVRIGGAGIFIVECKRHPKDRVKPKELEALAYRIMDAGADGAIIVSPIGLQEGAGLIANAEGVLNISLDANATTESYVLKFLNHTRVGVADFMHSSDVATAVVYKGDGSWVPPARRNDSSSDNS